MCIGQLIKTSMYLQQKKSHKVSFSLTMLTLNGLVQAAAYKVRNPCNRSTLNTALKQVIFSSGYPQRLCTSLRCLFFFFLNYEIFFHSANSSIIQSLPGVNMIKTFDQHLAVESLARSTYNVASQSKYAYTNYFLGNLENVKV